MPGLLKLALWLLLGLLTLLLLAVAVLVSIDLGRFSATAERQLSALLAREVAIDGGLSVRVGRIIEVELSQARVGGGNAGLPDLLQIGEARVELATVPLLFGRVEVHKARLNDTKVALVEREDGSNNFSFPTGDRAPADGGNSTGPTLQLMDIELRSFSLRYDTPRRETPTVFELGQLTGEFSVADDFSSGRYEITASSPDLFQFTERPPNAVIDMPVRLALETRGEWQDGRWQLQQFDARIANSSFSSAGSFDSPPNFQQTDLNFDMNIGSLAAFSKLAARALPDLPARLRLRLLGDLESVRIEQLDGQLGADSFSGSAAWVDGVAPQLVTIVNADRLDLSPFFPPAEPVVAAEEPVADPYEEADNARAIPDQPLSLDRLAQRDLRVSLQVGELIVAPRRIRDLVLRISVEDGAFFVPELSFKSTSGNFSGELGLLPHPDGVRLLTEFAGEGVTAGLPAETPEDVAALPAFRIHSVLAGRGATTRELAASLDGYVAMTSGSGRIRSAAPLYFASDFFTAMTNTLNPFREVDEFTEVRCSAIALTARNGVLEGEPLTIVQTNRFSAELRGSIDLGSEDLDINIRTIAEKGLGVGLTDLINPFTRIGGTLARPRVELDRQRAVREGSFYIATLGLSLAVKRYRDRKTAGEDRCKLMLDEANPDFEELTQQYRRHTDVYR
ncbi:MAG: AsmA family protein [Halieaceae bacterium]|nr:AsmA family protein [Halieaceae bacterium]